MSKKFSRILQAAQYQTELTAYLEWLQGKANRGNNVGKGKAHGKTIPLYVTPFGLSVPPTLFLQTSAVLTTWEAQSAKLASFTKVAPGSGNTAIKIKNFKAARINIVSSTSGAGTPTKSHITGASYLKKAKTATSVPFGEASAGQTELAAFTAIKAEYQSQIDAGSIKVYLIPEVV